jgi:hypothetical protein
MQGWRDWQNYPLGVFEGDMAGAGGEPGPAVPAQVQAQMQAALRVLAAGSRRAPAPAARSGAGGARAGHVATDAQRRAAFAEYERVRAVRDARTAAEPRMAAQLEAKTAGWPCRWWRRTPTRSP